MTRETQRAHVIGSGPNGLAAAITLAQAGLEVKVYEAEMQPGGAVRTMELTLPGFRHDFGSAVHPMAAGSPFFATLALEQHGLQWIHGAAPLAHRAGRRYRPAARPAAQNPAQFQTPAGVGTGARRHALLAAGIRA